MADVSVLIPEGRTAEEMWQLHATAALLENRCPRCMGELLDGAPDRPGWYRCRWNSYPDGWWRRDPLGYEWRLGINPHTGEHVKW